MALLRNRKEDVKGRGPSALPLVLVVGQSVAASILTSFWSSRRSRRDLLLTDVVMPRMGGKELAEHFRDELPETKVMFTSGYPGGGAPKGVDLDPGTPMLAKPFMPDAVAAKGREVLDTPALAS
jgi:CheY-like chemotaxis protein